VTATTKEIRIRRIFQRGKRRRRKEKKNQSTTNIAKVRSDNITVLAVAAAVPAAYAALLFLSRAYSSPHATGAPESRASHASLCPWTLVCGHAFWAVAGKAKRAKTEGFLGSLSAQSLRLRSVGKLEEKERGRKGSAESSVQRSLFRSRTVAKIV